LPGGNRSVCARYGGAGDSGNTGDTERRGVVELRRCWVVQKPGVLVGEVGWLRLSPEMALFVKEGTSLRHRWRTPSRPRLVNSSWAFCHTLQSAPRKQKTLCNYSLGGLSLPNAVHPRPTASSNEFQYKSSPRIRVGTALHQLSQIFTREASSPH